MNRGQPVDSDSIYYAFVHACQQERKLSRETVLSYRDTMKLFIVFCRDKMKHRLTKIIAKSNWALEAGGDFQGEVPSELVLRQGTKISIAFGKIPGIKAKKFNKYFGEDFEVDIKIQREFAGKSKYVTREDKPVFRLDKDLKKDKPLKIKMADDF